MRILEGGPILVEPFRDVKVTAAPLPGETPVNSPTRRQKIETMLAQDPQDQFLRYALAMELEKEGEHEQSVATFRGLMQDPQPHVPSFLMAGQNLTKHGRVEEAREVLRIGIEEARRQNNDHAAGEMGELLASIGSL